VNGPEWL